MGTVGYTEFIKRDEQNPDAKTAYRNICREKCWEDGNEYDSGHIGLSEGMVMLTSAILPRHEAEVLGRRHEDATRKNDAAGCVAVGQPKVKNRTAKRTITMTTTGHPTAADLPASMVKPGERVAKIAVVSDDRTYAHKVIRNRGAASRVFVVVDQWGKAQGEFTSIQAAADAITAARDASIQRDAEYRAKYGNELHNDFGALTIREEVRRDGTFAAEVVTTLTRKVAVEVTRETFVSAATVIDGWLFMGNAAS